MKKEKFDGYAKKYDSRFVANSNLFFSELELLKKSLNSVNHDSILSVGCGSGLFESKLKEEGIIVKQCIEPSIDMADIATQRGIDVEVTTIENYNINKDYFDVIYFNGSSSYIVEIKEVYEKCFKALKNGGSLILIDVPKESGYGLLYLLAKNVKNYEHLDLSGVAPKFPYPIELVSSANWHTTNEKLEIIHQLKGVKNVSFFQTLCKNPLYTNDEIEEVKEGYEEGGYVSIIVRKI